MSTELRPDELRTFWAPRNAQDQAQADEPISDALVESISQELGYRLPACYVTLMRSQNGGQPRRARFLVSTETSWAKDHVAIHTLFGIGRAGSWSLCGAMGSNFTIRHLEYPPLGVYFGDSPRAGHDMVALDYRDCGPRGEPSVVHVDMDRDFAVTRLAPSFADFTRDLVL